MASFGVTPNMKVASTVEPKQPLVHGQMCQGGLTVTSPVDSCVSDADSGMECPTLVCAHSPAKIEGSSKSGRLNDCSLGSSFPEKIYDRENESRTILEAFERACASQKSNRLRGELLLVTGSSGTGKTSLVETVLRPKVEAQDGVYVDGKFDLSERREQFYAIVQAMGVLARALEKQPIARLRDVRAQLASQKETVQIFLDLIPTLSALLDLDGFDMKNDDGSHTAPLSQCSGSSCSVESIESVDSLPKIRSPSSRLADSSVALVTVTRERLKQGMRNVFAAICSPTRPVVFFLDDLQWAEPASLDLFSSLIVDRIPGLLIVGACRDDEVDPTASHLSVLLREVESMKATIVQVVVSNIGITGLSSMLLDSPFHMVGSKAQELARLVLATTNGNMLFVLQLLNFLLHEGHIYRSDRSWTFDDENEIRIILRKISDARNLIEIGFKELDKRTREVLAVASCLGSEFSERLLTAAVEVPVEASLQILQHSGFLKKPRTHSGTWRFVHDQIQQSAYALIPPGKREQAHLRIGRNLWRVLSEAELDLHAYVVVTQLLLGADLINDRDEREQLAILLLQVGESAAKSSSHATAQEYISKIARSKTLARPVSLEPQLVQRGCGG